MDKRYFLTGIQVVIFTLMSSCTTVDDIYRESSPIEDSMIEDRSNIFSGNQTAPVQLLLKITNTYIEKRQYVAAIATMERAIRIEPRNPTLWQSMAKIRLKQGLYDQAEALAMKTSSFSRGDKVMLAENWHIISLARKGNGDTTGAASAMQESRVFGGVK